MARRLTFGMQFDFRNPRRWHQDWAKFYAETLEFAAWTEQLGFDKVHFSEHHCAEDGYLPSPLMAASALAPRTSRIKLSTAIALAPFYHPTRLAEDCAVLDIISGGRMEIALGLGYKPDEFTAYGAAFEGRGTRLTEMLQIIRGLWNGEAVTFKSQFFDLDQARIMPLPVQAHPALWVGGSNLLSLRRAARFGDGVLGGGDTALRWPVYVEELKAAGRSEADGRMIAANITWLVVSEDPERTAREVAPHVLHSVNTYSQWNAKTEHKLYGGGYQMSEAELIEKGPLRVMTPDDCITFLRGIADAAPIEGFYGLMPPAGYPLAKLAPHIELFAKKVLPALRG